MVTPRELAMQWCYDTARELQKVPHHLREDDPMIILPREFWEEAKYGFLDDLHTAAMLFHERARQDFANGVFRVFGVAFVRQDKAREALAAYEGGE